MEKKFIKQVTDFNCNFLSNYQQQQQQNFITDDAKLI